MKKAFSLIELLISLIIISVITAAFAPVINKKIKQKNISIGQKNLTGDCPVHQNCALCYEKEKTTSCLVCLPTCAYDEYENRANCNCIKCSAKFNNCYNCTESSCTKCNIGYGLSNGVCTYCGAGRASDGTHACISCNGSRQYSKAGASSCSDCPTGQKPNSSHTDCEAITCEKGKFLDGNNCLNCAPSCASCTGTANNCTSCIAGYNLVDNTCKKYTDVPCLKIGNICVAKYNAGDYSGLSIPSNLVVVSGAVLSNYYNDHTTPICWQGQTAASCDYQHGTYSGCFRTVCTYSAADIICKYHGWRLPSAAEGSVFYAHSGALGERGLQICNSVQGYYYPYCSSSNACPNSHSGCHPYFLWMEGALDYSLIGGYYQLNYADSESWALSVRCVRDL